MQKKSKVKQLSVVITDYTHVANEKTDIIEYDELTSGAGGNRTRVQATFL